jgi:hypothetical protein
MEADVRLIKSDIFPLLEHITLKVINRLLIELNDAGLINLYENNGLKYLHVLQFETHQRNLRKDREAKSVIPPPNSGPTPDPLRSKDGPTPDLLPHKLREEKLREAKLNARANEPPVDNSQPEPEDQKPKAASSEPKEKPKSQNTHGERWTPEKSAVLDNLMQDITNRWGMRYHGRVMNYVRTNFNRCNPDAMIHCLRRLISDRMAGKDIPIPEKWLEAVLNGGNGKHPGENGTFEGAEHERRSEEFKSAAPVSLGDVLRKMGATMEGG